ncbi:MAG: elongation factor-1 alpha [Pseudomonadota bacterium]
MSDTSLHPHYPHYSELPLDLRVLYTAALFILAMGYSFGVIYVFNTYAGRDGNPSSLSYQDMVIAYSGSGKGSRLESALRGSMANIAPADELSAIVAWVQQGADKAKYETDVRPTIEKRCVICHDGNNPRLTNLGGYDYIKKVTEKDTGTDVVTLVRGSHIHMFGLAFIFFLIGLIFSHADVRPVWVKSVVVALPFVAMALDVSSWYLTKLFHPVALVTMATGGIMVLCFVFMWVVSVYQMWFSGTLDAMATKQGV